MKIALYVFLFGFSYLFCFPQDSVITVNKIPPEGLLLNKGWNLVYPTQKANLYFFLFALFMFF